MERILTFEYTAVRTDLTAVAKKSNLISAVDVIAREARDDVGVVASIAGVRLVLSPFARVPRRPLASLKNGEVSHDGRGHATNSTGA